MKKLIVILLLTFPLYVLAQQGTLQLKGKVFGKDSIALSGVNINLFEEGTNKKLHAVITDEKGSFTITAPSKAIYLSINYLGYIPYRAKPVFENELIVHLQEQTQLLKEITVNTQRPLIEQQFDRTVMNVDGNMRLGIDAVDILKKIPGVVIKNGTEILLENKAVNVMMDGKSVRMSGNDLMNLLSGTSPAMISQIEVIHSPSAKVDAQGDGAVINIKTLKRQTPGYDMNLGLTTGHGWKYPTSQSISAGLTYRSNNDYVYGSYSYGFGKQSQEIEKHTFFQVANQRLDEKQTYKVPYGGHNVRIGWDHYLKNKDLFGVLLTAYQNDRKSNLITETNISAFSATAIDSMRYANSENKTNSKGVNLNFNYKTVIDSAKKQELTMDADVGVFDFTSDNQLGTQLLNTTGTPIFSMQQFLQDGHTSSKIYSYKADYTQKLHKGTLESGFKASYVDLSNQFNSVSKYDGGAFKDRGSNDFLYQETLLAAYVSSKQTYQKFTIQLGLRAEETITSGNSLTLSNMVKRDYLNLFPNALVAYKFGKNSLSFSYARRIGRPSYNALNPFVIVNGAYDVSKGNPYLNPSFTNSYRLGYNSSIGLSVALSHSMVKDVITDLREVDDLSKVSTSYKANMNQNYNTGISMSYYKQFFKLWDLSVSGGSSFNRYQFDYQNGKISVKQLTAYASIDNHFKLPKDWWIDVSYYGQSKATYGYQINLPYYFISSTIGKGLWKNKATLSLAVNDIFFTSITRSEANYGNVNYNLRSQYDSRNFRMRFNYRFGNSKIEMRKRSSGSTEEQGRTQ